MGLLCIGGSRAGEWVPTENIRHGRWECLHYRPPALYDMLAEPMDRVQVRAFKKEVYVVTPWATHEGEINVLIPEGWTAMQAIRELLVGYTRRKDER